MELSNLPKQKGYHKKSKRLGMGRGSGKGKTGGRGTKGQKARGKIKLSFEGGQLSLIKRLPFQRGKGRFQSFSKKPLVINVKVLNLFEKDSVVDLPFLIKRGVVKENDVKLHGVKILGGGELKVVLKVSLPTSNSAKKKIEAAGGTVVYEKQISERGK